MIASDTIVALSSGRPPAGVAVVRVSGSQARIALTRMAGRIPPPRRATLAKICHPDTADLLDDAIVLFFEGPQSATGENVAEFHCHGGRATVDAVIRAIASIDGIRQAEPGEFTRRALQNGRIDLTEAEGLADLLAAETEIQRQSAILRAGGAIRQRLEEFRGQILVLSARAEVAIDYADEDEGMTADTTLASDISLLSDAVNGFSKAPRVEPLRNGVRVVLAGPPNAGKSSLLNALTKSERAIVTEIAGTTRDTIEVPVSLGGLPFVFVDTAGLRESDDVVEAIGIKRAESELEQADIVLWMGDAHRSPSRPNLIQLFPKADLDLKRSNNDGLHVSAVSGEGLDVLVSQLVDIASTLLPRGGEIALDDRQHMLVRECADALRRASQSSDAVIVAEELRAARAALDAITGLVGIEDLLDTLFGKFCLGK